MQVHGATAAVVTVAAGGEFSAALDDGGRLWSWGAADRGQLGVGPTDDALFVPAEVRRHLTCIPHMGPSSQTFGGRM